MIQNHSMQGLADKVGGLDAATEDALLVKHLVSEIVKGDERLSLTLTAKGVSALVQELSERLLAEKMPQQSGYPKTGEDLLTKQQVMEMLGVSSTTLWLWEQKGYLVPVKIGRKVFYSSDDINDLRTRK